MEAIFSAFGIDWRLLLIDAFNFGLLLAGLTYFLYKPVLRMLEERRQRVSAGLDAARESRLRLARIERERASVLRAAGVEADQIVAHARSAAADSAAERLAHARRRAEELVEDAAREAAELKRERLEEGKHEVAKLVVLGMEKLMAQPK